MEQGERGEASPRRQQTGIGDRLPAPIHNSQRPLLYNQRPQISVGRSPQAKEGMQGAALKPRQWCDAKKFHIVLQSHGQELGVRSADDLLALTRAHWEQPLSSAVHEKIQSNGRRIRIDERTGIVAVAAAVDRGRAQAFLTTFRPNRPSGAALTGRDQQIYAKQYFDRQA